ncbi:MAG TPA: histone deacetylase [Gemmataceae bacterium]|nr:histone deacetylase [Gemmataceae bacterium]
MVPLIYSPRYNIKALGLERWHPFDTSKYQRIHDWLIRQGLRRREDFIAPHPCTLGELSRVHSQDYLRSLKRRRELARIFELLPIAYLPAWLIDWRVLRPMRWATGGTLLACRLALERGMALNLGGGYHHASGTSGGGFCIYADVPLALAVLHDEKRVHSVLIADTDAHQGNGTADAIRTWPWAHLLDLFEEDIYPQYKVEEEMPVPLPALTSGMTYLEILSEHLPKALDRIQPDLLVYNAGSDVLESDPLSWLRLTPEDLAERDLYVVTQVRERGIPLAMVLSGGYGPASWEAHARSIEGILARFDRQA